MHTMTSGLLYGIFLALAGAAFGESRREHLTMIEALEEAEIARIRNLWTLHGPQNRHFGKANGAYPCAVPVQLSSAPTSVHRLRPENIRVVGSMGDSLTAGSGIDASNILEVLIQYRGLSWSGGGSTPFEDQVTLPNILKKLGAEVHGYATGNGDENSIHSKFNVAVIGSTSGDLVNQAKELVKRMQQDPQVDYYNDWKVITILSGNNDLCDYCTDPDNLNSDKFYQNTMAALDVLHAELPRTFVNLVEPINVSIVRELNKGFLCSAIHIRECACAAFPRSADAYDRVTREAALMQGAVEKIALSGRYDTRDDFTVVYQPFFNKTYVPTTSDGEPDLSYFAPDCFHFSRKGQAAMASALWNNMLQPVSKKQTSWSPGDELNCPFEDQPFLFTNQNSDLQHRQPLAHRQDQENQPPQPHAQKSFSKATLFLAAAEHRARTAAHESRPATRQKADRLQGRRAHD